MLFKLNQDDHSKYNKVKRVTLATIGWKEKDLEKLISENILDFVSSNDLMTIATERQRKEEPDILALDKSGDLYIFELKRWSACEENLLQVLRYGQFFGKSNYDELNDRYRKYQGNNSIDLAEAHSQYFSLSEGSMLSQDMFNKKQRFIVITNGLDQDTVESIIYWKGNGLSIDAIVYWVFEINNQYFIEFNTYSQIEDNLEYESRFYVLNTNFSNNPRNTEEMLSEKKAAAYYPGWREKIQKLQKDDLVFLYKNWIGIIAYGYADGNLNKCECDGHEGYEYNMKLQKFHILKEPISASKMKEITNQGFSFRQTMFAISENAALILLKEAVVK